MTADADFEYLSAYYPELFFKIYDIFMSNKNSGSEKNKDKRAFQVRGEDT